MSNLSVKRLYAKRSFRAKRKILKENHKLNTTKVNIFDVVKYLISFTLLVYSLGKLLSLTNISLSIYIRSRIFPTNSKLMHLYILCLCFQGNLLIKD